MGSMNTLHMQGDIKVFNHVAWALSCHNRCCLIPGLLVDIPLSLRIWLLDHWHLLTLSHCEFILSFATSLQKSKSGEGRRS